MTGEIPVEVLWRAFHQLLNKHVRSLMERDGEFPIKRPVGSPEWQKMIHLAAIAGGKAARGENERQALALASIRTIGDNGSSCGIMRLR